MKMLFVLLITFISCNVFSQDIYGSPRDLEGMKLVYAGKFVQDGTGGHVPTVSGTPYNPYGVTATTFYDSTGCCRITLETFPSSVNVSSAYLHPLAMSNDALNNSKVWAVSTASVVTVHVFNKQYATFVNGYSFTLFVYAILPEGAK